MESVRGLPARLKRCRVVPDDRCCLCGSAGLLHPPPYRRSDRLLVKWVLFSSRAEPRHRAYGGVLGPEDHGDPRNSANCESQPATEGTAGRGNSSLWRRSGSRIRVARLPFAARRALRRSRRRGISRGNRRDEAKIRPPCCRKVGPGYRRLVPRRRRKPTFKRSGEPIHSLRRFAEQYRPTMGPTSTRPGAQVRANRPRSILERAAG